MISERVRRVNAAVKLQFCLADLQQKGCTRKQRSSEAHVDYAAANERDIAQLMEKVSALHRALPDTHSESRDDLIGSVMVPRPPAASSRPLTARSAVEPRSPGRRNRGMRQLIHGRMCEAVSDRQHWIGFQRHVKRCRTERVQSARHYAVAGADIVQRNVEGARLCTAERLQTSRRAHRMQRHTTGERARKAVLMKRIQEHNRIAPESHCISTLGRKVPPEVPWSVFLCLAQASRALAAGLQKKRASDRLKIAAQKLQKSGRKIGYLSTMLVTARESMLALPVQESLQPDEECLAVLAPVLMSDHKMHRLWGLPVFVTSFISKLKGRRMCTVIVDAYRTWKKRLPLLHCVAKARAMLHSIRICQRAVRRFLRATRATQALWENHFSKVEARMRLLHRHDGMHEPPTALLEGEFLLKQAIPDRQKVAALRTALQRHRQQHASDSQPVVASPRFAREAHLKRQVAHALRKKRKQAPRLLTDVEMSAVVSDCLQKSMKRFVKTTAAVSLLHSRTPGGAVRPSVPGFTTARADRHVAGDSLPQIT